jgi:electron transfer flavoprotein beta subunit
MKIAVCIRQVPSTETRITVSPQTNQVDLKAVDWVISPYDEYALEEALRVREKFGGTVTAISLGPERVRDALKTALATGSDNVLLITDENRDTTGFRGENGSVPIFGADSAITAQVLAAVLRRDRYDLILCGGKGVDDDMGYVGIALAELLNLPHVSGITRLEFTPDSGRVKVYREIEGATEVIEATLPAVFTTQKGLNEPRYPTLRGMMLAGKKEIPVLSLADLGLDTAALLPRTRVIRALLPSERKAGRIITGAPADSVRELVKALHEEAKVV